MPYTVLLQITNEEVCPCTTSASAKIGCVCVFTIYPPTVQRVANILVLVVEVDQM